MTENNPKLKELRQKAMALPQKPGVYLMRDKSGDIIYIGKAKALKNRVSTYFGSDKNHQIKVVQMVLKVSDFDYIVTDSEFEALVLENSFIKQYMPKYNILLKDAKGYSYIRVTDEPWPRITESKMILKDGAKYIGPFVSSFTVKETIDEARKIFQLPSCTRRFPNEFGKGRPCLNFYIKQCFAPCRGKTKHKDYLEAVGEALEFIKGGSEESVSRLTEKMAEAAENLDFERAARIRDRIVAVEKIREKQKVVESTVPWQDVVAAVSNGEKAAVTVLRFKNRRLCDREDFLFDDMETLPSLRAEFIARYYDSGEIPPRVTVDGDVEGKEALEKWLFEKAGKKVELYQPQRGEQIRLVEMCKNNAAEKLAEGKSVTGKQISTLDELGRLLGLDNAPSYIEAYDISNLAGGENVGAMVVFENAKPLKSAYRKFKIKTVDGQDDYASMAEMLERRLKEYQAHKDEGNGFGRLPDLILLDGGKGHVGAVGQVVAKYYPSIPVFGMVKDDKHRTRAIAKGGGEISINSNRSVFTFISAVQDEVHRFAIGFHRNQRKKAVVSSVLLSINGVGSARAQALMKHFKTIKNIENATLEELCKAPSMNKEVGQKVYDFFCASK